MEQRNFTNSLAFQFVLIGSLLLGVMVHPALGISLGLLALLCVLADLLPDAPAPPDSQTE